MFVIPYAPVVKSTIATMAPGMPPAYWWVTAIILGVLLLSATIDAFTAAVPDTLIFLGVIAVVYTQWTFVSWNVAETHLLHAFAAWFIIWGINFIWYQTLHTDALGMGDAKWTMLAVACFGTSAALFSWGVGAILACLFIAIARFFHFQVSRVTFAPFLFIGLLGGLWWLRFIEPALSHT